MGQSLLLNWDGYKSVYMCYLVDGTDFPSHGKGVSTVTVKWR
jgi:hypothetical protein